MFPDFIVIGGMKCGSTSLDHYLKAHPQISMPGKELDFFSVHSALGVDWYKSKFKRNENTIAVGETSVSYTKHPHHPGVPEKIHSLVPDVKLIYVVRDPIERVISHYMHGVYADFENRSFEEVLETDGRESLYIYFSLYYYQIEKYLEYFSKDQILVISLDDLKTLDSRINTLKNVFKFLGVDETFDSSKFEDVKYKSSQKGEKKAFAKFASSLPFYRTLVDNSPDFIRNQYIKMFTKPVPPLVISDEIREKLVDIIKPDTEKFRQFTNNQFESWSL